MYRPEVVFILSVLFYSALVFLHLDLQGERLEDYHELFHCVNWRKRVFASGWIRGRGCFCYQFACLFSFSLYCFSLFFVPGKVIGVGVVGQCGTSVRFNEQEGYGKCFHQCT